MADLRISELAALVGANLAADDLLPIVDISASETKKITVTDLVGNATTLIADATIPGAKILFSAGQVPGSAIAAGGVNVTQLADDAVTAAKLGNESTVDLVTTLPASGAFIGQLALDTDDLKVYCWNGSTWQSIKAAGSVNSVVGGSTGIVNITVTTAGDEVTINTTLDNTSAAAQFLAGPTAAAGAATYRTIAAGDLPTSTTSAKGAVQVNGNGLVMSGDTLQIDNTVTANSSAYHVVQYTSKGLVSDGRTIQPGDLPLAGAAAVGVVYPGSGLVVAVDGQLNHSNTVSPGTYPKVTYNAQGHVTAGSALVAADIPEISTDKLTSGLLPTERIANDAVTGAKLADSSTAQFGANQPIAEYTGQLYFNSLTRDIYIWDGNVWQPIGISVGEIVFAGTYNANTNLIDSVTSEGTAVGLVLGQVLPAASSANNRYYLVVSEGGTGVSPAPTVALSPPDIILSNGSAWTEIDVSQTVTSQVASSVVVVPAGGIGSNTVQAALEELDVEKLPKAGGTVTGELLIGSTGSLAFEGVSDNAYETTLGVVDPTADRSVLLPNVSGTVITTGDTGTVTSTMIADGTIVNADINASAAIVDTKLATISTAGKVANSATTATSDNTASAIVARDASGNFTAGTMTGSVTGAASLNVLKAGDTMTGALGITAGTAAAPSAFFSGDPNTGLYSPGADQVAISTGGTGRVFVNASGNVGVATAFPDALFHAKGAAKIGEGAASNQAKLMVNTLSGTAAGIQLFQDATESWVIQNPGSSTALTFGNSSTERLRITSDGNVGIGTSSPNLKLHVTTASSSGASIADGIGIYGAGNVAINIGANSSVGYGWIQSANWGSGYLPTVINPQGGNVGIGTSSPSRTLDVTGTARISSVLTMGSYIQGTTQLDLYGDPSSSSVVRIDSTGRVGVGTTPGLKLDVVATGDDGIRFSTTGTNNSARLELSSGNGTASGKYAYIKVQNNDTNAQGYAFGTFGDDRWVIRDTKANSERLCVTSAGLVGIGTSAPDSTLHIEAAGNTVEQRIFTSDNVLNATASLTFGTTPGSRSKAAIRMINSNAGNAAGDLSLLTDSGSSGLVSRLYIAADGKVGIGTTSPAVKTEISGTEAAVSLRVSTENAGVSANNYSEIQLADNTTVRAFWRNLRDGTGAAQFAYNSSLAFLSSAGSTPVERARIDGSGRLLVGTSTARANFYNSTGTPKVQVESTGSDGSSLSLTTNFSTAVSGAGPILSLARSGATSLGSNTLVAVDNTLGNIIFLGADGSEFVTAAQISAEVDGTPGANDMPGRLIFSTTADGASSPTERMRVSANGVVTVKNGAVAEIGTLTDAATITPDFAAACNFTVTLGGNRTLANPTNLTAGQSGSIFVAQDGTGSRTLAFGSYWDFTGGTAPTLTTAANAVDRIDYIVRSATSIHAVFTSNYS